MPIVTIVIPLYNKERFIQRALDSVLAQTYQDYEVVVVDDGSTDNGPSLVAVCRDFRIHLIRQRNAGPGAARNRGLREGSGKYVAFLDADDEWMPEFLENSVKNLNENQECVLSTCNYFTESNKTTTQLTKLALISPGVFRLSADIDTLQLGYITGLIHSAGTVLCLRETIECYGGFYEKGCLFGEDRYLWLQVLLNHPIFYDSRKMFFYHCEASDLATFNVNREIWPAITDPEPLRMNCPDSYLNLLNRYLAVCAIKEFHLHFSGERIETIQKGLAKHPLAVKIAFRKYLLLRIKLLYPYLVDIWRALKYGKK